MKVYVQTETKRPGQDSEVRPAIFLLETQASEAALRMAFESVLPTLGQLIAIPAAAHEHNLKTLLLRDLAALGITASQAASGEAEGALTLRVCRRPKADQAPNQAEVFELGYELADYRMVKA